MLTTAQLARTRKALESEEAKREQQEATQAEAERVWTVATFRAWRKRRAWELHQEGYIPRETVGILYEEKCVVIHIATIYRDIERREFEEEQEAFAQREGHTRTKIAIAHGHDVRDAEDGTVKQAIGRMKGRICKKA